MKLTKDDINEINGRKVEDREERKILKKSIVESLRQTFTDILDQSESDNGDMLYDMMLLSRIIGAEQGINVKVGAVCKPELKAGAFFAVKDNCIYFNVYYWEDNEFYSLNSFNNFVNTLSKEQRMNFIRMPYEDKQGLVLMSALERLSETIFLIGHEVEHVRQNANANTNKREEETGKIDPASAIVKLEKEVKSTKGGEAYYKKNHDDFQVELDANASGWLTAKKYTKELLTGVVDKDTIEILESECDDASIEALKQLKESKVVVQKMLDDKTIKTEDEAYDMKCALVKSINFKILQAVAVDRNQQGRGYIPDIKKIFLKLDSFDK